MPLMFLLVICEDYLGEIGSCLLICGCAPGKNLFSPHGKGDLGLTLLYMDKDPTKQGLLTAQLTSSILTMTKRK